MADVRPAIVTALLCVAGVGVVSQLYLPIPLIDYMAERFGVTPEMAALAGSLFGLRPGLN